MNKHWLILVPELGHVPERERMCVLERARHTEFDTVELVGLALGVALTAAMTQYVLADHAWLARFSAVVVNFVVALPLLAVVVFPLHVRRLRRGVHAQLEPHGHP